MSNLIRTLIADDEPAARESTAILLSGHADIEVVATCKNGKEAAEGILLLKPDLVLLDIQMPEMNGFEVLDAIKDDFVPAFIFVTAFDQYALRAFEASALDYLLKPYDDERFYQSLEKAKQWIKGRNAQKYDISQLLSTVCGSRTTYVKKLIVKSQSQITFIPVATILCIESEGNFVKVHTETGTRIATYTFTQLNAILDPKIFVRIHKSYIINVESVDMVEPHFHGDYFVTMKDGSKIKLSRNYKESLDKILYQC